MLRLPDPEVRRRLVDVLLLLDVLLDDCRTKIKRAVKIGPLWQLGHTASGTDVSFLTMPSNKTQRGKGVGKTIDSSSSSVGSFYVLLFKKDCPS